MGNNKIDFKDFLPGIAWFFIVAFLTLMPGKDIPEVSWLDSIPQFDKFVHAGLFGGITLLFCLPFIKYAFSYQQKLYYFIRIALAAVVWGITVEFLQKFFIPGRDFDLLDWAADSIGVAIALWICIRFLKYFEKKKLQ
jgi:VanZ family protein